MVRKRRNWRELTGFDTAAIRNALQQERDRFRNQLNNSTSDAAKNLNQSLLIQYENALEVMNLIGAGSAWIKGG